MEKFKLNLKRNNLLGNLINSIIYLICFISWSIIWFRKDYNDGWLYVIMIFIIGNAYYGLKSLFEFGMEYDLQKYYHEHPEYDRDKCEK